MTQNNISCCPEREQLREGLDMSKLDDIRVYFRRYLSDVKKVGLGPERALLGCWIAICSYFANVCKTCVHYLRKIQIAVYRGRKNQTL